MLDKPIDYALPLTILYSPRGMVLRGNGGGLDMYALVSTMNRVSPYLGRIVSLHRTVAAADRANAALQRRTRRCNGSNCYIPTCVVELITPPRRQPGASHKWVLERDCRHVAPEEHEYVY